MFAGAYREPKYNPAVASAFEFAILNWLFLSTGGVFGSTTSPAEYEPYARARAFLAMSLSRNTDLVQKHSAILDLVQFDTEPNPESVTFVQAKADFLNPGVINPDTGLAVKTPHFPFVDDTLMADILYYIKMAMAASLESLYLTLGYPDETKRRSPLSIDKFYQAKCSWIKEQLGLIINTRDMTISLPQAKVDRLLKI